MNWIKEATCDTEQLLKDLQEFISRAPSGSEPFHSAKPYIEDLKRILLKHIHT
jgi:hypothetical protein